MNTTDSGNESYDQGSGLGLKTTNVQRGRSMEEAACLVVGPKIVPLLPDRYAVAVTGAGAVVGSQQPLLKEFV